MPETGICVACKSGPYMHAEQLLCTMCYTSPYYTARRKKSMEEKLKVDGGGLRFDEGKERVDLIPADALMELGRVYGAGAKKYAERNWERGMPWSKCLGPLLRHLFKWMRGEKFDPEDGQLHIAKVAWNAVALLTYEIRKIGLDDRMLDTAPALEIKSPVAA